MRGGEHNGDVAAVARQRRGGGGGAAAAFSLEEGSQGKQGMAEQEKAWHGELFRRDTVS